MSDQPPSSTPTSTPSPPLPDREKRLRRAQNIIVDNVFWAAFMGLMPLPIVDAATVSAVQLKMINELAVEYDQRFSRHRSRAIITALLAGLGTLELTRWSLALAKWIPGVGSVSGGVHLSLMAGAVTYAVGKVFVAHFEEGGGLRDLQPDQHRDYFQRMYHEGTAVVRRLGRSPS